MTGTWAGHDRQDRGADPALDALRPDTETVLLLHAAVVGRSSLSLLARRLRGLGFRAYNPAYPNRRLDVAACAESLVPTLKLLEQSAQGPIHLVGHSMGGLVARRLLHLHQPANLGRLVTLGTPHLGSPLADLLHRRGFYQKLFGPAGQDLTSGRDLDWPAPWPPPYPIGLLAGHIPIGPGTFILPWNSDGTVTRGSSQPPGGSDYVLVPATHTTLPYLKRTARLVASFLRTGSFIQ